MFSIKKNIALIIMVITGFNCISRAMEQEAEKKTQEDKEIIQILRESKKAPAVLALIKESQEGAKSVDRFRAGNDTLVSFNHKNNFITIYGNGKSYYRNHLYFVQLCIKANNSDSQIEDNNDTFDHSNREDYSIDDAELLAKQESKKKCRCILI